MDPRDTPPANHDTRGGLQQTATALKTLNGLITRELEKFSRQPRATKGDLQLCSFRLIFVLIGMMATTAVRRTTKILVLNPNSSKSMTHGLHEAIRGLELSQVHPSMRSS